MKNNKFLYNFLTIYCLFLIISLPLTAQAEDIYSYISSVTDKVVAAIERGHFPRGDFPAGRLGVILDIILLPDGTVYFVDVVKSSGIEGFDDEARSFVKAISPYPPLPQDYKNRLKMRLPLEVVVAEQTEDRGQKTDVRGRKAKDRRREKEEARKKKEERRKKNAEAGKEKTEDIRLPAGEDKKSTQASATEPQRYPAPAPQSLPVRQAGAIRPSSVAPTVPKIEMSEKFRETKEKIQGVVDEIERLYKIALDNSDPAKVAQEQLSLAGLKINEARRNLFPKVEMQYSISEGETITDPYESESYALQLKQNLYDKGKTMKTLRKEQLNLEVAEKEYDKTLQALKFEVIRAYLAVLGKQEELTQMQTFSGAISENYELAKSLHEAGAISRIEFIDIEAEYQRTVNMIEQIDSELKLAREKLRAAMNLSPQAEVQISEKELAKLDEIDIDVDECIELALANKPDVRLWEISLQAAEYARDIAHSESAPRFDLVTSYGASGEVYSEQDLDLAEEWKMMGVVTWLFGGNSFEVSTADERVSDKEVTEISRKTQATTYSGKLSLMDKMNYYVQRKEAEIAYAQNLSNLSKNKQEVAFETKKSFLEYQQAFAEYKVALFEDKFSSVNLELKKESFKIGKANLSEIVRARADYMRKKLALVRAKTSYFISLASLDKTTAYSLGLFSSDTADTVLARNSAVEKK